MLTSVQVIGCRIQKAKMSNFCVGQEWAQMELRAAETLFGALLASSEPGQARLSRLRPS